MSMFKVKFKIKSLELQIEGERETVPLVTHALQQQFAGLLKPGEAVLNENQNLRPRNPTLEMEAPAPGTGREGPSRSKAGRRTVGRRGDGSGAQAADFKHDPSKWGVPQQTWKMADKLIWLMYVMGELFPGKGWAPQCLVETFNKQFKEAGLMNPRNIYRDLGNLKQKVPSLVGADATQTPPEWFLTDEGKKHGSQLIRALVASPTVTTAA
jgi:hypothetical protein